MNSPVTLRLGTRASLLALRQSTLVAAQLQSRWPALRIEPITIKTSGDKILDQPLRDAGGKGLFIKELEQALLDRRIDFAVHSYKDVPVTMPLVDDTDLLIAATPKRHDPRDVLACASAATIKDLPPGATVGTSSLRRRCQLLALRPDLIVTDIRGNIDTRLKKWQSGQCDALVLAMAGVQRAELWDDALMHPIAPQDLLPAPGQGALALQCRRGDHASIALLQPLDDPSTRLCVQAERQIVADLAGDCHSPIAALAEIIGPSFCMTAVIGPRDPGASGPVVRASAQAPINQAQTAVDAALADLRRQGAWEMLHAKL